MYTVEQIIGAYLDAKSLVIKMGYEGDIDWQETRDPSMATEREFLAETAWVIMNSGMRYQVVRAKWPEIREIYLDFCSAEDVIKYRDQIITEAMKVFGNRRKLEAIVAVAEKLDELGIDEIKKHLIDGDIDWFQQIPFIGPVTKYHLAKSFGVPVAKPDRHLVRIAEASGYDDVQEFCKAISEFSGEKIGVVDIVLWRFAELDQKHHIAEWNRLCEGKQRQEEGRPWR